MKVQKTGRGFSILFFSDQNRVICSLQKSSLATDDCIWFGCEEANPQVLVSGQGWRPVQMPPEYIANTRMHLSRKDVKKLLPYLQKFVDTGDIK